MPSTYPPHRAQYFAGQPATAFNSWVTASGDKTIVAAPGAGFRIIVTAFLITTDTNTNFTWKSASTALTHAMQAAANVPFGAPFLPEPLIQCAENEALVLNSSAAITGGVTVVYRTVKTTT